MKITKEMDCNAFFSGGAGMFLQYHDVIKPVYLYVIIKMLISKESYGLPLFILENMSDLSIMEWYTRRRYINPLKQLDFNNMLNNNELDELLKDILKEDETLYKLAPPLNIQKMLFSARQQHLSFPIFVYNEYYDKHIEEDCNRCLQGFHFTYVYGDIEECLKKCDQNFTYIFSNIELMKKATKNLAGSCSHILLAENYRYNYIDNMKTLKYDLKELAKKYPFARLGTTSVMDMNDVVISLINMKII